MTSDPYRVGLIGCGNISGEYMRTLTLTPAAVRVTACADRLPARAHAFSRQFDVPVLEPDALLDSPAVDLVLNLTPPRAHFAVSLAALRAGKPVYSEKPLAVTFEEGQTLLATARHAGVGLGCAPDTFLGQGLQTCRRALDEGRLGVPVAASAFMVCHGHEDWHPAPDFYYQPGGGPLFDMGPYYLTALVNLMGPLRRVSAFARASFAERVVTSRPGERRSLKVETNTHYAASLEFESGALATLIMSFDVWQAALPPLEIYGSEGTLAGPDPNTFGGPVRLAAPDGRVAEVPLIPDAALGRGAGLVDLVENLRRGEPPRASAELALHVLEAMTALDESARLGRAIALTTRAPRPRPLFV